MGFSAVTASPNLFFFAKCFSLVLYSQLTNFAVHYYRHRYMHAYMYSQRVSIIVEAGHAQERIKRPSRVHLNTTVSTRPFFLSWLRARLALVAHQLFISVLMFELSVV